MAIVNLRRSSSSSIPPRAYLGNPRRRAGMGDGNSVNPTTMWTPSTGFLAVAGNINSGVTQPTFQAPQFTPPPACSSGPATTADSAACIQQLLANQQGNMNAENAANYAYDLQTCEANYNENLAAYAADGITPPPNTCMSDTFGITPTVSGGYTGSTTGAQPQLNTASCPQGQTIGPNGVCQIPTVNVPAPPTVSSANNPTVASVQPTSQTTQMIQNSANQANAANGFQSGGTGLPAGITTTEILYAVGGLAALALLMAAIK